MLLATLEQSVGENVKLPALLGVAAGPVIREAVRFNDGDYGALLVALPKKVSRTAVSEGQAVLTACADRLAARLHLEARERASRFLEVERAELTWLANIGELANVLAHEFNNFLNVVLLHVAVLEQVVPEDHRRELTEVRRQGAAITALVKRLQQYRRDRPDGPRPLDFNRIVHEAAEEVGREQAKQTWRVVVQEAGAELAGPGQGIVPLRLDLAPDLPPVEAVPTDLRRLVAFLLSNAAAAAAVVGGSVTVRTAAAEKAIRLTVTDQGLSVGAEELGKLFEATSIGREGTRELELAACKSLARRLHGKIQAESGPEGGVEMTLELPAVSR
jgi:signal transduction histidine kinase